jgi:glc operon protein GlcG
VSGASSAQQDEELAIAGAKAVGASPHAAAPASFFPNGEVKSAFAKGAALHETGAYKVHASRREKAGEAEVHEYETDVIYVVDGSATFVTGGSVVNARVTSPGEIRGAAIEGGDTRRLRKGDVVVVPRGTPHWFKEAKNPFLYFVVKPLAFQEG